MICPSCARQADGKKPPINGKPWTGPAKHRCEAPLTCTCHHRKRTPK